MAPRTVQYTKKENKPTPPRSPRSQWSPVSAAHAPLPETPSTTSQISKRSLGKSSTRLSETEEAELLSQATAQAMTAARSILLAGGSESTALSTARAAATSILAPSPDSDFSQHGLKHGQSFLGRRKGKRQAEIVGSMALLSVKQSMLQYRPPEQPSSNHYSVSPTKANNAPNTPKSRPPPSPLRPVSPTRRRTPLRPPAAERHARHLAETPPSMTSQWLGMQRTPVSAAAGKNNGRSDSSSGNSSSGLVLLPPTLCLPTLATPKNERTPPQTTATETTKLLIQANKLPLELPKSRPKTTTRDLTDSVPNEDPIYSNDVPAPTRRRRSYSSSASSPSSNDPSDSLADTLTDDSFDDEDDEANEAARIAHAIAERKQRLLYEQSAADAFLASISNIILCGMGTSDCKAIESEFAQSRDAPMSDVRSTSLQSRDHEDGAPSWEDDEDDDDRGLNSTSTASSAQVLKELEEALSAEQVVTPPLVPFSPLKGQMRQFKEQAPMAAAPNVTARRVPLVPPKSILKKEAGARPVETISLQHTPVAQTVAPPRPVEPNVIALKYRPYTENPATPTSTVPATPAKAATRIQVLSQRVKFRSWMKRRRGTAGDPTSWTDPTTSLSTGKVPVYE